MPDEEKRKRHIQAVRDYDRRNTVGLYLKLNDYYDADIIGWLERQDNKQGAIKRLIRAEISAGH